MRTTHHLFLIAVLLCNTTSVHALDIIWEPLNASTHPDDPASSFDQEFPAFDPAGAGLLNNLLEVEREFEAAFDDAATIRITYWWDVDMTGSGQSIPSWIEESGGAVTHSVIRFNSAGTYYIDPTPENDSEYNMSQVLNNYGSNSIVSQGLPAHFTGSVPDQFEAGYNGTPVPAGPADGAGLDLLTLIFQEVGHSLGLNAGFSGVTNGGGTGEVDDGDFDVATSWVNGNVMDMLPRGAAPDPLDHLFGNDAVMGNLSSNERTRPSAADFFAIALADDWTNIDLPRQDFLGGGDWDTGFNWMGGQKPLSLDAAFVRHGGAVTLGALGNVSSLLIDNNSSVDTSTGLLVADTLTIQKTTGGGTPRLIVNNFGDLLSERVTVDSGARLDVLGGNVEAINSLDILAGGELRGHGTVDISDIVGTLTSEGLIRATLGGELVIISGNNLGLELGGTIEAIDGDIRFETGMLTAMTANMTVSVGREVAFNSGGSVGAGGLIQLEGTDVSPATTTGSNLFVDLNGTINAKGLGVVENTLLLQPSGSVTTEFGDPNSEIRFSGTTFFQGGIVQGDGTARQIGDAFVFADTTINIDTYDMDGIVGNTVITIEADNTLNINSTHIEVGGDDFDGTIHVRSGTLDVAPSWLLDGAINLTHPKANVPELKGDGILTIRSGGQLNVSGEADINQEVIVQGGVFAGDMVTFTDSLASFNQPTSFSSTAAVETFAAGDVIDLNGITTMDGGSYTGLGTIKIDNQTSITRSTTIDMANTDLDGDSESSEINIEPRVTFTINSYSLELARDDGFDGVMNNQGTFFTIVPFRLDGELNMIEAVGVPLPTLAGLSGFEIFNTGVMNTDGDALINRDTTVRGAMNIGQGLTQINGTADFQSTAVVTVAGKLELNGATTFAGGSYSGAGLIQFNSTTTINSATTLSTAAVDLDGASGITQIDVNDTSLVLNVEGIDEANNSFAGTLNVSGTSGLLEVNLNDPQLQWQLAPASSLNFVSTFASSITMLSGSPLLADGTITANGKIRLAPDITLSGSLATANSNTNVHFAGSQRSFIHNSALLSGAGQITIDNGSTMNIEHATNFALELQNKGRLEINFATMGPSIDVNEPGVAVFGNKLTLSSIGELAIDLGGLVQGFEHDFLTVLGTAQLGGTLEVQLIDSYLPSIGDTFQVLTAASIGNTFDTIVTLDETNMFGYEVTAIYSATDVVLQIDNIYLSADFDHDDDVDGKDFLIWQLGLGLTMQTDNSNGDATGDGLINDEDLAIWEGQYGSIFSPLVAAAAVPEPSGCVLLVLGAIGLLRSRKSEL